MRNTIVLLLCIAILSLASSCNGKIGVHGKVTFSDGKPLTKGTVIFQNEKIMASGNIQQDGSYTLGMLKDGDGCEPGSYQVFISGAADVKPAPIREKPSDPVLDAKITLLINKKMTQPDTSGLTCIVEKEMKLPYNITVEPPK
jgi:hypothetical protein